MTDTKPFEAILSLPVQIVLRHAGSQVCWGYDRQYMEWAKAFYDETSMSRDPSTLATEFADRGQVPTVYDFFLASGLLLDFVKFCKQKVMEKTGVKYPPVQIDPPPP